MDTLRIYINDSTIVIHSEKFGMDMIKLIKQVFISQE